MMIRLTPLLLLCLLGSPAFGQDLFEQSNDLLVREIDGVYRRGLGYLADTQDSRGCWPDTSYGSEPGVVGVAILAFLARGDDPEFGPYRVHYKKRPAILGVPCTTMAFPPSLWPRPTV